MYQFNTEADADAHVCLLNRFSEILHLVFKVQDVIINYEKSHYNVNKNAQFFIKALGEVTRFSPT